MLRKMSQDSNTWTRQSGIKKLHLHNNHYEQINFEENSKSIILLHDVDESLGYYASNNKLEGIWKEAVVIELMV
jgi:hypothetical protein